MSSGFGFGGDGGGARDHLAGGQPRTYAVAGGIRAHSFIWPADRGDCRAARGVAAVESVKRHGPRKVSRLRRGTVAGSILLLVMTASLLAPGPPFFVEFGVPDIDSGGHGLEATVGNAVVGIGGTPTYPLDAGIMINANLLYHVQEFAAYDPMVPKAYFSLDNGQDAISAPAEFEDIFSPAHHLLPSRSTLRNQLSARADRDTWTAGRSLRRS